MQVAAGQADELARAAAGAHRRMRESASRLTDADCRGPSLLPGWSRGHVLTHWARNADGQSRMLAAAMRGEVAVQYPGGDAQRNADIEAGAVRSARLILGDADAALSRVEETWRQMPADAWARPTAARVGTRPAWQSVWARWRETEIHHVDLDTGYTHRQWPADFTALLLPRVLPTLQARLADPVTVRVEVADHDLPAPDTAPARAPARAPAPVTVTATTADAAAGPVTIRGPASAILCWLIGRPAAAAGRGGQGRRRRLPHHRRLTPASGRPQGPRFRTP